ncbi:hypothetical protein B0H19DRAFT_1257579 [Mycena capillaripes]|nr:hypothetical protein B0H19DRAFT_1257579 [Mycena capillaripes]
MLIFVVLFQPLRPPSSPYRLRALKAHSLRHYPDPIEIDCFPSSRYSSRDISEKTQDLLLLNVAPSPSILRPPDRPTTLVKRNITLFTKKLEIFCTTTTPAQRSRVSDILDVSISASNKTTSKANPPMVICLNLSNSLNDKKPTDKFATASKLKLDGAVNHTIKPLNVSQEGLEEDRTEACLAIQEVFCCRFKP